ncbi:hypothetical protein GCM10010965_27610 [Caldalkalibacillus thermarum]|uniref:CpaF family protein n=1 Tax=Caldalkalibacillus thermarum TaxID=296745 RepID=UPI001664B3BC|nr:ATPase, T2SS/T4P/T4SS family [Caldalkalibacillus thermarum]GGK33221.1 hypothetical protein GCM10010965_27610 [Caldalkalibacillus thermarum]
MNRELDKLAERIKKRIVETGDDLQNTLFRQARAGEKHAIQSVKRRIQHVIREERIVVSDLTHEQLINEIFKRNWGLGAIQDLYDSPDVNEVWVNGAGPHKVWVERSGKRLCAEDVFFEDEDEIRQIQQRILSNENQELNQSNPVVESKMLDGTRVTLTCPPETSARTITLRKHQSHILSTDDYIRLGTLDRHSADILAALVRGRVNILLIGATSSGKTSMLKWLAQFIQSNLRIGVLETTYELALDRHLPRHNVICFEEQPRLGRTIVKQFHTMLRESPDVIILGEARGQEADMMIKTFRRGHPGSMGTIHSNSPEAAIQDLADMIMEDGRNWDQKALYLRVARSIDVIVQLHLEPETGIRRLWRVTEVECPELADEVKFRDLVCFDPKAKGWTYPNQPGKRLTERLALYGVTYPQQKMDSAHVSNPAEKEVVAWSL